MKDRENEMAKEKLSFDVEGQANVLHKEARGHYFLWFCGPFVWSFREHLVATRSRKCTKETG